MKMRFWRNYPRIILTSALASYMFPQVTQAIPAFSRKYQTSCTTCHEAFPTLNTVGETFRLNGFKFREEDLYIKDEPVSLGDEAYKRVWPKAIWPSDIPGLPPISIRVKLDYKVDLGGTKASRSTFDFPDETEILAAGSLGDNMSFFGEIEIEDGEVDSAAWLQYEDILADTLGLENALNVRLGTLGFHTFGLFTARDHNRVTKEHYQYTSFRVPYPAGFAKRNTFRLRSTQPGVEINGFGRHWLYAVGVVEGDGGISDKDYYGQVAFKIGGRGFDGSRPGSAKPEPLGGASTTGENSLILSAFGYRGTAEVENPAGARAEDDFYREGVGAMWRFRDLRLGGGYIQGRDDNPYAINKDLDIRNWFAEAYYFVLPWVVPVIRYERSDLTVPSGVAGLPTNQDAKDIVVGVKLLARANVAINVEGRFFLDDPSTKKDGDQNQFAVRVDYAF